MPSDALSGLGGILNSFLNSNKTIFYLPFLACTDKTIIFVVVKFNIIIYKKR